MSPYTLQDSSDDEIVEAYSINEAIRTIAEYVHYKRMLAMYS